MLSLEDLQLLEAVRATGSLSRAAERLGKAASTVSYAARQLEERLDALLFDRAGYRIALTPAGMLLVEQGAQLHAQAQRLTERVKQVARGWESELRIVTDELANTEALLPLVADFDALNSGVRLRIAHEVLGGTWEALLDQRADLVVAATNEPPAMVHLQWFELAQLEWVFAVSPRHPLAGEAQDGQPLSVEAIAAHRSVVVADTSRLAVARSYGVQTHQERLAMPSMRAKIAAQVAGLGVGCYRWRKCAITWPKAAWWPWPRKTRASPICCLSAGIRTAQGLRCSGGWTSCVTRAWWGHCCIGTFE